MAEVALPGKTPKVCGDQFTPDGIMCHKKQGSPKTFCEGKVLPELG